MTKLTPTETNLGKWFKEITGHTKDDAPPAGGHLAAAAPKIPTVKFDSDLITNDIVVEIQTMIRSFVDFTDLNPSALSSLDAAAVMSIKKGGGGQASLYRYLYQSGHLLFSKKRTKEITLLIHNRATALTTRNRQLSIGITRAKWLYAGRPCCVDIKHMTNAEHQMDLAHRNANKQSYDVRRGLVVGSRYAWPGYDPGCRCVSKSIIPGLDDGL